MAPKVDEKDISQVIEFTGVSREDAKSAIRSMDFDITRAIDYILTGQLESDKLNPQTSSTSSSLSAKGMFNSVRQIYTRSKSPLKNRKSTASSATTEVINVNEDDLEDEHLRLAVEMSLQESGGSSRGQSPGPPLPPNKPHSNSPYFGPARASDYHEGSWGMVVSGSSGQETGIVDNQGNTWSATTVYELENVEPEERKREEGQPVVLDTRGTSGTWTLDTVTSLAGLMTILHNIPKAREALLLASPRDPGHEDEPGEKWWKGKQPLSNPASSEEEDITGENVLRETARIMAFLDDTERSYGRLSEYLVTALRNDLSKFPKRGASRETEVTQAMFLERWSYILNSIPQQRTYVTSPLQSLFVSQIYQPPNPPSKSDEISESLCEISITITRELSDAGTHTILDALETLIWWGDRPACLKSFSDFLLIRLKRDDREDGAGVEILPKLPMSRFAFDNYEKTEGQIRLRRGIEETLVKLRKTEESLSRIEKGGQKYYATKILEAAIRYVESLEGREMAEEEADVDENSTRMDIDTDKSTLPAISKQLKSNMQNKLPTLFDFPDYITRPNIEDPTAPPIRISLNYILRGIIVDQHLTYFSKWECYTNPYKRKLIWFKSDFSSSKPEITTIEEGEVLSMARERGSDGITTVYVREDVPEAIDKVLPPDYLREFVQKDNQVFQKELNPPVIQVSEPTTEVVEMDTTEGVSAPPMTPGLPDTEKSRNPFLRMTELMGEEGSDKGGDEQMLVDDKDILAPPSQIVDTNPFRKLSGEHQRVD